MIKELLKLGKGSEVILTAFFQLSMISGNELVSITISLSEARPIRNRLAVS